MTNTGQPGPLTLFAIEKISCKYQMRKNRLAGTSLFLKSLFSTTSNSVTLCFYWLAFVSVSIASYKSDQPALNSGAGLGIISTINTLFVIGFVGISRKQRPHEGSHKKSLYFCEGYHKKSLFSEWGFVMCGVTYMSFMITFNHKLQRLCGGYIRLNTARLRHMSHILIKIAGSKTVTAT
ncbi:hypothetical protein H1Z24_004283 [Salmonella enterica]|nr:hypothetical protein [Salmonella enterica]